jgi:hypothetical protein
MQKHTRRRSESRPGSPGHSVGTSAHVTGTTAVAGRTGVRPTPGYLQSRRKARKCAPIGAPAAPTRRSSAQVAALVDSGMSRAKCRVVGTPRRPSRRSSRLLDQNLTTTLFRNFSSPSQRTKGPLRGLLLVELSGLEPATSWVRFTRKASPPFASVRRLCQPHESAARPIATLRDASSSLLDQT